jgi:hypothetical protein
MPKCFGVSFSNVTEIRGTRNVYRIFVRIPSDKNSLMTTEELVVG